ncbi:MAG: response regulator [Sphingobium sp.]|nr:response regulator [Sphingobium sp.]
MHVLIIEDDALIAMNLQMFLENLGADSTALAASQAQAVREALDHRPDLIASDVKLTEGTGPEAVKAIRSQLGDIPVIYITGNPEIALDADPSAPVIDKPIRWLELVKATQDFGLPPTTEPAR